jgi:hypothetical protein
MIISNLTVILKIVSQLREYQKNTKKTSSISQKKKKKECFNEIFFEEMK